MGLFCSFLLEKQILVVQCEDKNTAYNEHWRLVTISTVSVNALECHGYKEPLFVGVTREAILMCVCVCLCISPGIFLKKNVLRIVT